METLSSPEDEAYRSATCSKVLKLLGIPVRDHAAARRVERFLRSNGTLGVIEAANVVAAYRSKQRGRRRRRNSWPKFLRVHNRAIAQRALLYPVVHLVEVALRARVDSTLERLHGRGWYTEPALYLDELTLKRLLGSHDMATVVRTDAAGARVVGPQKSAAAFLSRLPLWAVQRIVEHGLRTRTLRDAFAPRADGKRVDGLWVSESLTIIRDARNAVAHHRPLVESHFDNAYSRCIQLLELLEFDLGRTNARLEAAVHTFRHDRNLMPVVGIRGSSAPHG